MVAIAGTIGVGDRQPVLQQLLWDMRRYGAGDAKTISIDNVAFGAWASNPHQHIWRSDDRRLLVVADAHLDNAPDIARSLGDSAIRGRHVALLGRAWERWSKDCIHELVGSFAAAVFDHADFTMTLFRDPIGQRPLFFKASPNEIYFASMPGCLTHPEPRADLHYLGLQLALGLGDSCRSAFEGIERVRPGEILTWKNRRVCRSTYWMPTLEPHVAPDRILEERFRAIVDEAVRCRLEDAGDTAATQLSSGFDSTAVTTTAARVRQPGQSIIAFTSAPASKLLVLPRDRSADESEIAAATAGTAGVDHHVLRISGPLFSGVKEFIRSNQGFTSPVFNVGWWTAIRAAARQAGARVLLTGELGNFGLSAGGLPALRDFLSQRQLMQWLIEARAAVARPDVSWKGALFASFGPSAPRPLADLAASLWRGMPPPGRYDFVRSEFKAEWDDPAAAKFASFAASRREILRAEDPGTLRLGSLAQAGIEERDPTADVRLLEFTLRLRPEHLLRNGEYRPLARAALADRMPSQVLNVQKRGMQGADWLGRFDRQQALHLCDEIMAGSAIHDLLDTAKLRKSVERWVNPQTTPVEELLAFGINVTSAISAGIFLREVERYPTEFAGAEIDATWARSL